MTSSPAIGSSHLAISQQTVRPWWLWVHLGSTWWMVAVIWFVQVVHYPLLAWVGPEHFSEYEARHRAWIFWVVAPPMLLELATAVRLSLDRRADGCWRADVGLMLLAMVWALTFFFLVPLHERLQSRFTSQEWMLLIAWNWPRTVAWSLRGGLAWWMLVAPSRRVVDTQAGVAVESH
jgi:hypothetical protein